MIATQHSFPCGQIKQLFLVTPHCTHHIVPRHQFLYEHMAACYVNTIIQFTRVKPMVETVETLPITELDIEPISGKD